MLLLAPISRRRGPPEHRSHGPPLSLPPTLWGTRGGFVHYGNGHRVPNVFRNDTRKRGGEFAASGRSGWDGWVETPSSSPWSAPEESCSSSRKTPSLLGGGARLPARGGLDADRLLTNKRRDASLMPPSKSISRRFLKKMQYLGMREVIRSERREINIEVGWTKRERRHCSWVCIESGTRNKC